MSIPYLSLLNELHDTWLRSERRVSELDADENADSVFDFACQLAVVDGIAGQCIPPEAYPNPGVKTFTSTSVTLIDDLPVTSDAINDADGLASHVANRSSTALHTTDGLGVSGPDVSPLATSPAIANWHMPDAASSSLESHYMDDLLVRNQDDSLPASDQGRHARWAQVVLYCEQPLVGAQRYRQLGSELSV